MGPDRDDLVFRLRLRATAFHLDQPDLRLRGAMAGIVPGQLLDVEVTQESRSFCLRMNERIDCSLGFGLERGWGLLHYVAALPAWLASLLDIAWVAALVLPFGFWMRARIESLLGGTILVLGLAIIPAASQLLPTSIRGWTGAVIGLALGMLLRRSVHLFSTQNRVPIAL